MNKPERLGDLPLEEFLADPSRKQSFVTPMFDRIAPRYDAFTRLFSFGMDAGWKRDLVSTAVKAAPTAQSALDLACGTGDIAVAIAARLPSVRVVGIDASSEMVAAAQRRLHEGQVAATNAHKRVDQSALVRVHVAVGDMMALQVRDASVDIVTAGYGVRNVPDARQAVREMARVLRVGGTLITLDFYRPSFAPWRFVLLAYLSLAGNAVGWVWHRDPVVYGYIARSIDHFMSWQQFSRLLQDEGLRVTSVTRHLGGGIAMHVAIRN